MPAGLDVLTLALLAVFGLAGGIGITAVGPGGVLPTIGMFLLTGLAPPVVAGTAIATHVVTGVLGTAAYTRSGQLKDPATRRVAVLLAAAALVATPLGVLLNTRVSGREFGSLLACAVALTGVLVLLRERRQGPGRAPATLPATRTVAMGASVAVAAGLFGLGGPLLCVPLLVVCGTPVLAALGAAQAQSVVIAGTGTVVYALNGSVDWALAAVVGVPELIGVVIGWRIAHAVPAGRLRYALIGALLLMAPYLALHG
ncbi:sulfite exporter TauE/SafE family protein [Streptomyces sp. NPDC041068]|uniref:sulfite exporter TauE/SafE family protein n=1 Tax=Streptomyces sp. NPDC041068 TaxID=3155130 RepID=UPI0034096CB0